MGFGSTFVLCISEQTFGVFWEEGTAVLLAGEHSGVTLGHVAIGLQH